jgi:hypothetical protein
MIYQREDDHGNYIQYTCPDKAGTYPFFHDSKFRLDIDIFMIYYFYLFTGVLYFAKIYPCKKPQPNHIGIPVNILLKLKISPSR